MAFACHTGSNFSNAFQQCIELPCVIATSDGKPVKGTKANSTKVYENRYEHATPTIMRTMCTIWMGSNISDSGRHVLDKCSPMECS